jgi:RHS repeat-associated protein
VNALNQLVPTPTPFTYDARGNQTGIAISPTASRTFDGLDRVTSASHGGTTIYLTYDALDRLAGVQAGVGASVRYLARNGSELEVEWNSNGGPIFYAYDNDGRPTFGANFTPNQFINQTNYLTDERGSLIGEHDGTFRTYAYDAYGRETVGVQHPSLLGYAGGVALPGAGLVHFRARAYDTNTGRFVSADPIGVGGGVNLYGYVGDDPINMVDPSGTESIFAKLAEAISSIFSSGGSSSNGGSTGSSGSGSGGSSGAGSRDAAPASPSFDQGPIVVTGTRNTTSSSSSDQGPIVVTGTNISGPSVDDYRPILPLFMIPVTERIGLKIPGPGFDFESPFGVDGTIPNPIMKMTDTPPGRYQIYIPLPTRREIDTIMRGIIFHDQFTPN